jgi:Arc/MetJ-type ribon-helix-helix transcriptional regulator
MTMTFKLDAQLEEQLRQRAAVTGRSASEVIRAALVAYLDQTDAAPVRPSAFDLGAGLFGRYSGEAALAQNRKRVLADLWADKHHRRQP